MKDFFRGKAFRVVAVIVAFLIGILIYQAASGSFASLPEAIVGTVVTPIVKVSTAISENVGGFFNNLISAKDIEKENKELKAELSEAYEKLSEFEKYKNENKQLKEMLKIREEHPDYEMESAAVIGRDSLSAFGKFTISKGGGSDIKVGYPVITNEGFVGIITHVGPTYSVVTTVLDPEINVGIYNSRTRETGVVGGSADLSSKGKTKLKLLPRDTALLSGDIIETSGIGGVFPAGILVGTIESINPENSGVSMYAAIVPVVDVTKVSDVVIVKSFEETRLDESQEETDKEQESEEKK